VNTSEDASTDQAKDVVIDESVTDTPEEPGPASNCVDGFCPAGPGHSPDPRAIGPYPVGVRTVTLVDYNPENLNEDGSPRTLVTEVWYPTTEDCRDAPSDTYVPMDEAPADISYLFIDVDTGTLSAQAARDAPVRVSGAPFPLIVFSHGAFAVRFQNVFFTATLASHGYVVVSPDHQNNTIWDMMRDGYNVDRLLMSAWHRPLDAVFLVDEAKDWTADSDNDFFEAINVDEIGISGHSFGGFTALAVACLIPEVAAIVPMAPAAEVMVFGGGCEPHEVFVPKVMMGGLMDNTLNGFEISVKEPFDVMPPPKWLLTVKRGGHYSFTDMCRFNLVEVVEKTGYPDAEDALTDGCGEDNWDFEEIQEVVKLYGIGLFNRYLRHSPGSDDFLTSEAGEEFGDEIEFTAFLQ